MRRRGPSPPRERLALGSPPVITLYKKTSEPIRIDHRQLEYPLVADMRREKTTEIHSIHSVSGAPDAGDGSRAYAPFYSFTHPMKLGGQKAYWHARRGPRQPPHLNRN